MARALDVRDLAPKLRHAKIFETLDALRPGDAFVLVNDHDPRPLFYQLQAERSGAFGWTYLEQDPDVWRVEIGRSPDVTGVYDRDEPRVSANPFSATSASSIEASRPCSIPTASKSRATAATARSSSTESASGKTMPFSFSM